MINHVYTQDEQDTLHDLYVASHDTEEIMHEVSNCRDNIRDELTLNISDGCIITDLLPDAILTTIRYIYSQLEELVSYLHKPERGFGD